MRPCFTFTAAAGTKPAVIALDDEIGFWGTQAKDFRATLDGVEGDLVVEINSPGGEVFAGLGIYNMLRSRAAAGVTITTRVTGVAASISSVIALAGDKREMPKNAFAMIHGGSTFAYGTESDMQEAKDVLAKINSSIRGIYIDRMGVDEAKASEMMAKDTWLTAEECKELGFATDLTDAVEATAKFNMARADLPENVRKVFEAKEAPKLPDESDDPDSSVKPEPVIEVPATPLADQIVAEAKLHGFEAHAPYFAVAFDSFDGAKARIAVAREISALCNVAGKAEMASAAIRSTASVADVRAQLVAALAASDEVVDNKQTPPKGQTTGNAAKPADVNPTALWASHVSAKSKGR